MQDPYAVLQVARNAEPEVVAAAYRSLARKYHPDGNRSAKSTQRMQEINEAYEILRDPAKRRRYDRANRQPRGQILWRTEESMYWSGEMEGEESTDWASSYARRRAHPHPIPRKGFLEKNLGCVAYALFAGFVAWYVLAMVISKL
jgi:curved DNA-binding protein CbpA